MKIGFLFPVIGLVIASSAVQAGGIQGRYEVNPVNDVVYEVVSQGAYGGAAFWCAAGEYVETELKISSNPEIYVAREAGPSETTGGKTAAQFTLDPAAAGITPIDKDTGNLNDPLVGEHISAKRARLFCTTG